MKSISFANRLKELRKEKNITQKKLAEEIGVSLSSIINYENSQRSPVSAVISLMSMYFGVSKEYLMCETNDPQPLVYEDKEILSAVNSEFETLLENLLNNFNESTDENKKNLFDIISELNSILGTKNVSAQLKAKTLATIKHDAYRENQLLKMNKK